MRGTLVATRDASKCYTLTLDLVGIGSQPGGRDPQGDCKSSGVLWLKMVADHCF